MEKMEDDDLYMEIPGVSKCQTGTPNILGDIVEKHYSEPMLVPSVTSSEKLHSFSGEKKLSLTEALNSPSSLSTIKGKSLFARSVEAARISSNAKKNKTLLATKEKGNTIDENRKLKAVLTSTKPPAEPMDIGDTSVIVSDENIAKSVHGENLKILNKMSEDELLTEQKKLLESIDPSLVNFLKSKKLKKHGETIANPETFSRGEALGSSSSFLDTYMTKTRSNDSSTVNELIDLSKAGNWLHFDVIENDKLSWISDISLEAKKLKPGEKFEARFDWKGVLLPYTTNNIVKNKESEKSMSDKDDDRELYLHGDEPHRPGYTLQELFRLARSNVSQQRLAAFGAIGGMLNIYNQGFYDNVLDLPITKIFFLLRFGFDDNSPAMLEVVSRALAYLFYNDSDESLLDFIYDNPGCHWQPTLQVLCYDIDDDVNSDTNSINFLQQQMEKMQIKANIQNNPKISAAVNEDENSSKTSMSDFELAERDLIDCLMRTDILQRIYFILERVRPDNSTVVSCIKILIRIARCDKELAKRIVNHSGLLKCLFENFLPDLQGVDTTINMTTFYKYPQHLCLKLMRILVSQSLSIALKIVNLNIVDKLQNYLYCNDDIQGNLIKVQIESLRVLRILQLLRVDNSIYSKFVQAFRYLLEWHFNHNIYDKVGALLLRQHASALLSAISCDNTVGLGGIFAILGDILYNCCCSWFHSATRLSNAGMRMEFSHVTLLNACINAIIWYTRNSDAERFRHFHGKYLESFISSEFFEKLIKSLASNSIILLNANDRRIVHMPLPNVGSIAIGKYGPQLIMQPTYSIFLLHSLWRLMELQLKHNQRSLFQNLTQPVVMEPLVSYLRLLAYGTNRYMATNFFAKLEIQFVFKLLCFEGIETYFSRSEIMLLVYNFISCLTAEYITEIEQLFHRFIFNKQYIDVDVESLEKWKSAYLDLVHSHYIVVHPNEISLSKVFTQTPILPNDWPYFQLKSFLEQYISNVPCTSLLRFPEQEILKMTFTFVEQLETQNAKLTICSKTEKLMYIMIAFMGPDSQFLEASIKLLLRRFILRFYADCKDYSFKFNAEFPGKSKFENLYILFIDHFGAASYGDESFSSLVLVPLAQKYDNKWRRRVWSDHIGALQFVNCDESLLIGGLQSYLEPAETESSILKAYHHAVSNKIIRPGTIPFKIAVYHVESSRKNTRNKMETEKQLKKDI